MTLLAHVARCELEIQSSRDAAKAATSDSDRYGHTWAEVDWLVAKQLYEEDLAAAGEGKSDNDSSEETDGFRSSS